MKITQMTIERMAWWIMLLLVIINIAALFYIISIGHTLNGRIQASKQNTADTRTLVLCIAKFFDVQDRQNKTLNASLDSCNVKTVR